MSGLNNNRIHIAIVMPDMELGGVEKSLLSFLECLKERNFLVSLLLFHRQGNLLSSVPDWVTIVELTGVGKLESLRKDVSSFLMKLDAPYIFHAFKRCYHFFGSRLKSKKMQNGMEFDVVIAYKDGTTTWYVEKNIRAKVKIAFIHTDFISSRYNAGQEEKIYAGFDHIYCVSKAARNSFVQALPCLSDKVSVFYNIVNPQRLQEFSKIGKSFSDDFDGLRILTVGRLSHEKGLDKAVDVLSMLISGGCSVRWYVVGEGSERKKLEKLVAAHHLDEDFVFLGEMENPYHLMADCDIYVQPSNYEGYCIALSEARALYCPVIACNFSGANEQIVNEKTGIVTSMSTEDLYKGIIKVIRNKELRDKMRQNLKESVKENTNSKIQIDEFCNFISSKLYYTL